MARPLLYLPIKGFVDISMMHPIKAGSCTFKNGASIGVGGWAHLNCERDNVHDSASAYAISGSGATHITDVINLVVACIASACGCLGVQTCTVLMLCIMHHKCMSRSSKPGIHHASNLA